METVSEEEEDLKIEVEDEVERISTLLHRAEGRRTNKRKRKRMRKRKIGKPRTRMRTKV